MKHLSRISILFVTVFVIALCLFASPTEANAATSGYYTYTVSNGEATITDVDTSISGAITIPSTLGGYPVTSIGDYAFSGCTGLTSVTIPDSVTGIGNYAFRGCTGLTSVTIGDSVTSIGYSAFSGCTGLTSVTIGASVTSIGYSAFYNCTSLSGVTIPDSVTSIGNNAFSNCSSLFSVTIGDSVTYIGSYAFYNCSSLTNVTIGDSVTSIGNYAFQNCKSLTSVTIPDSVTCIGDSAFSGCSSLESITVPFVGSSRKSATDTYQYPFGYIFGTSEYAGGIATYQYYYGSSTTSTTANTYYIPANLKSVTVTGGNILYGVFRGCTGLTSVTIGDSVSSIGDYAFFSCTSLTSMTIPDSVTSIGAGAFYYCRGLTSVTIPDSVTTIGYRAFCDCFNLTSVTYCGTEDQWNNISIGSDNTKLASATRYYHSWNSAVFESNRVCAACGELESHNWTLTADANVSISLGEDLHINLNGYDLSGVITTNGYKVYGMDSTTNEYTCDTMGYFSCVDENGNAIVPESLYTTEDMLRYMTIGTDDGYTFHRFYLGITNVSLAPAVTGFGYKAEFYGDAMVRSKITSVGYNLWLEGNTPISRVSAFKNSLTLRLQNFDVVNYGETPVNTTATITLTNGTTIESATASYSMRQMVELVNDQYSDLNKTQLSAVRIMIANNPVMQSWLVENIYKKT